VPGGQDSSFTDKAAAQNCFFFFFFFSILAPVRNEMAAEAAQMLFSNHGYFRFYVATLLKD